MATALWKTLLPYVLPEVISCPKAQIVNEIRRAAIDFCQRSQIWREDLDYLFFPAGVATADLDPPQDSRVCEVVSVSLLDGSTLEVGTHFTATTSVVSMRIMLDVDTKLIPTVALKPTLAAPGIPEELMEDWGYVIAYGAIASLKAMRGREWEDIPGAQIKNELFEDGIASAKIRAITGGAKRSLTVKPRSFM